MRYNLSTQDEQYSPSSTDVWPGVRELYVNLGSFKKCWFPDLPDACKAVLHRVALWIAGICCGYMVIWDSRLKSTFKSDKRHGSVGYF